MRPCGRAKAAEQRRTARCSDRRPCLGVQLCPRTLPLSCWKLMPSRVMSSTTGCSLPVGASRRTGNWREGLESMITAAVWGARSSLIACWGGWLYFAGARGAGSPGRRRRRSRGCAGVGQLPPPGASPSQQCHDRCHGRAQGCAPAPTRHPPPSNRCHMGSQLGHGCEPLAAAAGQTPFKIVIGLAELPGRAAAPQGAPSRSRRRRPPQQQQLPSPLLLPPPAPLSAAPCASTGTPARACPPPTPSSRRRCCSRKPAARRGPDSTRCTSA